MIPLAICNNASHGYAAGIHGFALFVHQKIFLASYMIREDLK